MNENFSREFEQFCSVQSKTAEIETKFRSKTNASLPKHASLMSCVLSSAMASQKEAPVCSKEEKSHALEEEGKFLQRNQTCMVVFRCFGSAIQKICPRSRSHSLTKAQQFFETMQQYVINKVRYKLSENKECQKEDMRKDIDRLYALNALLRLHKYLPDVQLPCFRFGEHNRNVDEKWFEKMLSRGVCENSENSRQQIADDSLLSIISQRLREMQWKAEDICSEQTAREFLSFLNAAAKFHVQEPAQTSGCAHSMLPLPKKKRKKQKFLVGFSENTYNVDTENVPSSDNLCPCFVRAPVLSENSQKKKLMHQIVIQHQVYNVQLDEKKRAFLFLVSNEKKEEKCNIDEMVEMELAEDLRFLSLNCCLHRACILEENIDERTVQHYERLFGCEKCATGKTFKTKKTIDARTDARSFCAHVDTSTRLARILKNQSFNIYDEKESSKMKKRPGTVMLHCYDSLQIAQNSCDHIMVDRQKNIGIPMPNVFTCSLEKTITRIWTEPAQCCSLEHYNVMGPKFSVAEKKQELIRKLHFDSEFYRLFKFNPAIFSENCCTLPMYTNGLASIENLFEQFLELFSETHAFDRQRIHFGGARMWVCDLEKQTNARMTATHVVPLQAYAWNRQKIADFFDCSDEFTFPCNEAHFLRNCSVHAQHLFTYSHLDNFARDCLIIDVDIVDEVFSEIRMRTFFEYVSDDETQQSFFDELEKSKMWARCIKSTASLEQSSKFKETCRQIMPPNSYSFEQAFMTKQVIMGALDGKFVSENLEKEEIRQDLLLHAKAYASAFRSFLRASFALVEKKLKEKTSLVDILKSMFHFLVVQTQQPGHDDRVKYATSIYFCLHMGVQWYYTYEYYLLVKKLDEEDESTPKKAGRGKRGSKKNRKSQKKKLEQEVPEQEKPKVSEPLKVLARPKVLEQKNSKLLEKPKMPEPLKVLEKPKVLESEAVLQKESEKQEKKPGRRQMQRQRAAQRRLLQISPPPFSKPPQTPPMRLCICCGTTLNGNRKLRKLCIECSKNDIAISVTESLFN